MRPMDRIIVDEPLVQIIAPRTDSEEEIVAEDIKAGAPDFETLPDGKILHAHLGQAAEDARWQHGKHRYKGDANIHLTTDLKDSKEPIVIYSSGVNNLMREVGNNPFSISKDYKDRDKRPNYNYTLEKVNNPNTLNKVMDGIDKNFYNLLSINDRSDIFALGSYTPASLRSEDMKIFQDLILAYNERLTSLCNSYHITYINTNEIGNRYNNSKANFHINTKGQIALAETILESIYDKKINSSSEEIEFNGEFKVTDDGSHDVVDALLFDRLNLYEERKNLLGYDALRHEQVIAENKSEISVFKKVLQKTK